MQWAWGLHRATQFRDLGSSTFVVHFGSEGDWNHVMKNGPWQYDFSVLIMKEYEGNTRPSKMVFDMIEVWVRIVDLSPGKRTDKFGEALGDWLGEVVKVDVDNEGLARGKHLRVRARISVFDPLIRGFYLKASQEDKEGVCFDFHYEKIPLFCFECGRLVHYDGFCRPPVESSSQWGEWLWASPNRSRSVKEGSYGGAASSNHSRESARTGEVAGSSQGKARVRDQPIRRNLNDELSQSVDSRTGGESRRGDAVVTSPVKISPRKGPNIPYGSKENDLSDSLEQKERDLRNRLFEQRRNQEGYASTEREYYRKPGTFVRKPGDGWDEDKLTQCFS